MKLRLLAGIVFALLVVLTGAASAQKGVPDPAFAALHHASDWIDPRLSAQPDASALSKATGPTVKAVIWANLPAGPWQNRNEYAAKLHHALGLERNALIVVVNPGGQGAGVSLYSNGLGANQDAQLARQFAPQIKANLVAGTAALARAVAGALAQAGSNEAGGTPSTFTGAAPAATIYPNGSSSSHGGAILTLLFLIVVVIVVALIVSASRGRKQAINLQRGPVDALRQNVLAGIEYIDHYSDVMPRGNPEAETVRAARQAAEQKYEQAGQILSSARSESDLYQAQSILDRAQADIQQARGALDRALGGTHNIPGDDAFRPPPLPQNQQQVNAIPQGQRAVSFFSGQPAPLGSLVPVTVNIGGQPRQVYATPLEADEIRHGQMPQVRAFNVGGQYVPWYAYNAYDPYRDYWQYQNSGWGGFGSGALAGFVGAELLSDMMMPRYDYGGYAFSPDFDGYNQGYDQGYNQGFDNAAMNNQFADYGNPGGGYDPNTYDPNAFAGGDQGGGTDFNDYSSTGDPGGGQDFSDFGGGDMGGGSDFGGGGDFGGDSGGGSGF